MTEKLEIYKCQVCGNTVEVLLAGFGQLVCCEQNMILMEEQTAADEMLSEKHVPAVTRTEEGINIKIGMQPHPMEPNHYITMIEAYSPDMRYVKQKFLHPGEEAMLDVKCRCDEDVVVRELCNIHGLWTTKDNIGE